MRTAPAILLLATAATAQAAEVRTVEVKRDGKRYVVQSDAYFDAPTEAVFDVLTDYDRFHRLSKVFKESRFIERDEERNGVVYTLARGCVVLFCKTIERTEYLMVEPPTKIRVEAIPEKSDVRYSEASWDLSETTSGTRVEYRLVFEPDFWVPPIIGPYVLKRALVRGGVDVAGRIERFAQEIN